MKIKGKYILMILIKKKNEFWKARAISLCPLVMIGVLT